MKIEEIKVQKIDCDALLLMDDDEMKKYIPAFGDRLAVVAYCKKKQGQRVSHSVLDKLKKKLNRKRGARVNSDSYVNASTTKSSKTEDRQTIEYKRIELGWKHFDSECKQYKQVRSQNGGGCRQLRVSVVWGKDDIIKEGKSLFFHKGKSSKGHVNDLLFTVQDFRNIEMGNETIEDVYKATCVKLLRLYVCTKSHVDTMSDEEEIVMGKSSSPSTTFELDETLPEPKNTSTPSNLDSAHIDNSGISGVVEVIDDVEHDNCSQEVVASAVEHPTEEILVSAIDLDLGASTVASEPAVHDVADTREEAVT
ncbi:hypothetical protein HOLleu_01203 [Holothuria leucospilota]|uniref:Pterin-binding domain-containing protein n=1 Tax=Holothuria leucospilota TaxID=206669 RepID=A0A9Q1CNQ8_HOLLE|nr:hypothetical protein HOLleu_01203 [Holothuria leucospilota]